jgi:hypothetical protein
MATLNEALPVYLGVGVSSYPVERVERLVAAFGRTEGTRLAAEADALIAELFRLTPDWTHHTLLSGTEYAVAALRRAHPELDDAAAKALGWHFSFSWK